LLLDEKSFCKLKNELNVIYFSNVAWKLVHMTFGSYVHSLLQIFYFSKLLWAIYEFPWFYLIYFWFLVLTHSYEPLDDVHASFAIFGSIYEQWTEIQIQLEDFHWNSRLSGTCNADSPRVRGGQSASVKDFSQRLCRNGVGSWNVRRTVCSISADGPHGFGYTGIGASAHWFNWTWHWQTVRLGHADGPRLASVNPISIGYSDVQ